MSGLPQFLVVGAQKAGTTTLQALLGLHPDVFLPNPKEVHYFTLHYSEGLNWYKKHFKTATNEQFIGEITPYYLFHPFAAARINADLKFVRIVILLRDPISRTISHYQHARRLGFEQLTLNEALAQESKRLQGAEKILSLPNGRHLCHQECSYLSRSLYRNQVNRYWDLFGRDRVLLLPSEELFMNPWPVLLKVFSFLDLRPIPRPDDARLAVCANASPLSTKVDLPSTFLKYLRFRLDDSYKFAQENIGWSKDLSWL